MSFFASFSTLVDVIFQSNWLEVLQASFMRNAFLGGTMLAVSAGLLGYFVVIRQMAFASHALAHVGFPGATGAVLIGVSVTLGLLVFTIAGALIIGVLGKKVAEREIATGTVLAFATGLGVLFSSLSTRNANTVTNVLFGNLLAISSEQLVVFGCFTVVILLVLALVARPLAFASLDPQVAQARGVPVRGLGIVFLLLLAVIVTMAVQVVGTLLLFALVVTPCATALRLTARPASVATLGVLIGALSVWVGLVLSTMFNLPPSFFIVAVATAIWATTLLLTREKSNLTDQVAAGLTPGHSKDHHHDAIRRSA